MKLITISGLDGSGKSTQINLLKEYFESQGQRVFYFHAGDFSIANKILGTKKDSSGKEVSVSQAGWLGIFLRKVALCIDLLRFKLLRNKLRNHGYDYILSDRYFYDTVVNIDYLKNKKCHPKLASESNSLDSGSLASFSTYRSGEAGMTLGYFVSKWLIKPSIAIYLQVDPEKIMRRERIPDQGIEYLHKKKEFYDQHAEVFEMKIIDSNRSKEEIFTEIKSLL